MSKPVSRVPLNGYPIESPFDSINEIREYLSGDLVTCLRCGRQYKGLASHLKRVHEMTADEYREFYGIPWTYGLVCGETSGLISENSTRLVAEGVICSHNVDMSVVNKAQKRTSPKVRDEIRAENLSEVNKDCTGEETARRKTAPKRGTPEYSALMKQRPQCSSDETKERLRNIWVGKSRDGIRGKMIRDETKKK